MPLRWSLGRTTRAKPSSELLFRLCRPHIHHFVFSRDMLFPSAQLLEIRISHGFEKIMASRHFSLVLLAPLVVQIAFIRHHLH